MSTQTDTRRRVAARRAERHRRAQIRLLIIVSIGAAAVAALLIAASTSSRSSERFALDYQQIEESVDRSGAVTLIVGDPDATVTLTDYSDFSCGHCADLSKVIDRIVAEYVPAGRVKLAYKPISFVSPRYSEPAAAAAICAAEQGRFMEMHDELWAIHDGPSGPSGFTETLLVAQAQSMGLDVAAFRACLQSTDTKADLEAVIQEALSRGIQGTPMVFVNDLSVPWRGQPDIMYDDLVAAIETALGR